MHSALNTQEHIGTKIYHGNWSPQHVPCSEEMPLPVRPLSITHSFILLANSLTNFLGRPWRCKVQANLHCSPHGMRIQIPINNLSELVAPLQESPRDFTLLKELQKLPPHVWGWDPTEAGLLKSKKTISLWTRKDPAPSLKQYPLSHEAIEGVKPLIQSMDAKGY